MTETRILPENRRRLDYKWRALLAVAIGTFMATLDSSIVNVTLPTLSRYFKVEITTVEWVTMVYLLTVTGLLLSVGRMADMSGRKRIYNIGFVIFTLGSLLCAVSGSIGQLIAFRALQAVGAAMLMANGTAILAAAFPHSERGQAMGLNGTIVASGLTVGPALGGILIHALGWRSVFTINLPIGIIGTLLAAVLLHPDTPEERQERFDIPGAFTLWLSLSSLLLALSRGEVWGWAAPCTRGLLILAAFSLLVFVAIERRVEFPTVDLSLFRRRLFAAGSVSALISYVAISTTAFLMPFYLQELRGYNTAHTGLMLTVVPLTMLVVAPCSGWLSDRIGSRGLSTTGIGVLALGVLLLSRMGAETATLGVVARLMCVGIGNGLFTSPNNSAIMGAVPPQRLGIAAGMISTVRSMGMVMGVACAGAVVAFQRSHLLGSGFPVATAFSGALSAAFLVAAGITVVGIFPSMVRGSEARRAER